MREALREEDTSWSASHKEGALLVADGATKPLQGAAFRMFVERLNMKDQEKLCEELTKTELKVNKIQEKMGLTAHLLHEGGTALLGGGVASRTRRYAPLVWIVCKGMGGKSRPE